jgi:hypothetical protein
MTLPPPKVCRQIRKLYGLLGSSNANEASAAREKLLRLLAEYGCSWNDLLEIIAAADAIDNSAQAATAAPAQAGQEVNVLGLVLRLVKNHVAITPAECLAVSLWILHCYVFDRFIVTPRLAVLSPVRGCGKTTLIELIELLTIEPFRGRRRDAGGDLSPARPQAADQFPGRRGRQPWSAQQPRAARGIQQRTPQRRERGPLCGRLVAAVSDLRPALRCGDRRAAFAAPASGSLPAHCTTIPKCRIRCATAQLDLVEALCQLEDAGWNEWCGPHDDRPPRKLTQGELARLLRPFHIRPKSIWPRCRQPGDKSAKGYLRSWFEAAWASYCPPDVTASQASRVAYLAPR